MKIVACMLARNEAHVIGLSARVALSWCDALVVLNHASTDRTEDVLMGLPDDMLDRLVVLQESGEKWAEMDHRQKMLQCARALHATHVAIVDADEILSGNLLHTIRAHCQHSIRGYMLQLPGYNLRGGLNRYHASGMWGNRWFSAAFADQPHLNWSGDCFHNRAPNGMSIHFYRPLTQGTGGIMHLWGSDERRLIAKHRLYRVVERIRWPDKPVNAIEEMYSWATDGRPEIPGDKPSDWRFAEIPAAWWEPYQRWMHFYDPSIEPWQEVEADRLIRKHGLSYFKGLRI